MTDGAFERLTPPWEAVALKSRDASVAEGSRAVLTINSGPLALEWTAEHHDVEPGKEFSDRQINGPFKYWDHRHKFEQIEGGGCLLEDRIEFELPASFITHVGVDLIREKLKRMFEYRHSVTERDVLLKKTKQVKSKRILVTGSSRVIGSSLVPFLKTQGHEVVRLVRPNSCYSGIEWDPARRVVPSDDLEGFDAVVHLAGDNIAKGRWTNEKKERLRRSRVDSTSFLVDALSALKKPPSVFVAASAIGFYGDRGPEELTEHCRPGEGFLANLCRDWEAAASRAGEIGIRTVNLRIGVVLTPQGGMLEKLLSPFMMGAGGTIGTGKQYISWISIEDVVGAIYHGVTEETLQGPLNAVSPNPCTNDFFTKTLGKILARPAIFPVPASGARIAFGQMADETMLASCRARPMKLESAGFGFRQPELESALRQVLGKL
ncbi:MAG: TIGR01777 family oxidoreductase [Candidatus Obscuribacterales bacterium]|nr:TIGR01777 family oxidoreductase [Candidatus Obscuribacterales bacterium]